MVRAPEGHGGNSREKRRHDGGEERATTWWGDVRLGELETDGRTTRGEKAGEVLGINGRNPAGHYTLSDTT